MSESAIYFEAFNKNDFSILPDEIKEELKEHIENICNSKSARKKEAKRIKVFLEKLEKSKLKKDSNEIDTSNMSANEYESYRKKQFEEYNINVYPHVYSTNTNIKSIINNYSYLNNNETNETICKLTGRIIQKRASSKKLIFYTIESNELTLQILANKKFYKNEDEFNIINIILSRGDFIGIEGIPHRSKRGELSIIPNKLTLLSPCLKLLPKNVKDSEGNDVSVYSNKDLRFRYRHLDWILNPENRKIIKYRSQIISYIRRYFTDKEFFEVETPTLNLLSGGANAKPFTTHINAFDMPMYLRIAPELKLKQMIIGGFEKVFEIGKQFRNEGVDRTHLPEFTSIEFYERGADYFSLIKTTEDLLSNLVEDIFKSKIVKYNLEPNDDGIEEEITIDFTPPYKQYDMKETIYSEIKDRIPEFEYPEDMFSEEARLYFCKIVNKLGIECAAPQTTARLLDKLVGELIEPKCINPTFITNHFQVMSPLAKYHRENNELTERFELFVAGKELCNAFTELNDPEVQERLFLAQVEDKKLGDDEAQMKDDEFIDAMKYGLAPTGGWGMGIDRLVMFLTNQNTIREVVSYPTIKPQD